MCVLGITGLRAYTTMATEGARRNVERTLLYCQLGVVVSLLIYLFTTKWGLGHFHFSDKGTEKFETALRHTHGLKNDAAIRLGIGRNTITRKIHELGIDGAKDD